MSMEKKFGAGTSPIVGIIGGSGLYESGLFVTKESHRVSTPWGGPSSPIEEGEIGGVKTFFLARHGKGHTIPAHRVNYRANVDALKSLGVDVILAINSVGSLKEDLTPGTFVLPDQFVDWTKSRPTTFYDGGRTYHVSMADPMCPSLIGVASKVAERDEGMHVAYGKTYVCIEGPRFSTRAESRLFRTFGDIIGMTLVPECQLAREREICYLAICMVTDYDVWSDHPVVATDVVRTLNSNVKRVRDWTRDIVPSIPRERRCSCQKSLESAAI
jgi:5'-methylthioadenosine phosphorylase